MNKKWIGIFGILVLWLTGCTHQVQGSGVKETTTRNLEPFAAVRLVGNYQINILVGRAQQVSVTTDNNLIPYIQTRVRGKTLSVSTKARYLLKPTQMPTVNVTVPELKEVTVVGNGTININGVKTDQFEMKIIGTGTINAAGTTEENIIKVVGSGQVAANNLLAQKALVKLVGTGNVAVYASNQLDVKVSGTGKVQYYGEPRNVNQKIAGSGEVMGIANVKKNPSQNP